MNTAKPAEPVDPYILEERICLIEEGCHVSREEAERRAKAELLGPEQMTFEQRTRR